jgi:hypothetical protein
VLVALLLLAGGLTRWWVHGHVDGGALATSVGRVTGGSPIGHVAPCEPRPGPGVWECDVPAPSNSGQDGYVVRVRPGTSCWTATRSYDGSEGDDLPARADGCVRLWQWSPLDLLS